MTTSSSDIHSLVTTCHYMAAEGVFCMNGYLYQYRKPDQSLDTDGTLADPVKLEGFPLQCPACEGKAAILTERGKETLTFLQVFARPFLREIVDELFEEREQR